MPRINVVTRHCNCIDFLLTVVDTEKYTVSTTETRVLRSELGRKVDIIKYFNSLYEGQPIKVVEAKKIRNVRCLCSMTEEFYFNNANIIETKEVN